jgi:hypothetical protein
LEDAGRVVRFSVYESAYSTLNDLHLLQEPAVLKVISADTSMFYRFNDINQFSLDSLARLGFRFESMTKSHRNIYINDSLKQTLSTKGGGEIQLSREKYKSYSFLYAGKVDMHTTLKISNYARTIVAYTETDYSHDIFLPLGAFVGESKLIIDIYQGVNQYTYTLNIKWY